MNNYKKTVIKKIFILFLLIQPLFDLNILYSDFVINIFKFSPSTIFRILMVFVLFVMLLIGNIKIRKAKKIIIYIVFTLIYCILHYINSNYFFNANITGTFNYSIFKEGFYLIRMFIPVIIIYITSNIEFTQKEIKKVINYVTFAFSAIIILGSVFKFGIMTYGTEKVEYGLLNLINNDVFSVYSFATRGIFAGSNRLGVLLTALLPINLYFYFKSNTKYDFFVILFEVISLILIGTRVSSYCWIIVFIMFLLLNILFIIMKKEKINIVKTFMMSLIIFVGAFLVIRSPVNNRRVGNDYSADAAEKYVSENLEQEMNNALSNINEVEKSMDNESDEESKKQINEILNNKKYDFIEQNYDKYFLQWIYVKVIYNYQYDPDFWINVMNLPFEKRSDGRKIQNLISARILELNNNNSDCFFGMGYSRFKSSDLYLESDIIVQFYTLGIIGLLVFIIIPYFGTIIKAIVYMLKNLKKNISFELLIYLSSICIFLSLSYFSGHILDEMITYIFLSFICGIVLNIIRIKEIDSKNKEIISVIIPVYNCEKYLKECLNSVVNQTYGLKNLQVIIVNDASTDESLKICKEFKKKYKFLLINSKKNGGQAVARNKALNAVEGKYICFLDSDDLLYQNAIELLYNSAVLNFADIVMSKLNSFDVYGKYGYYSDKYMLYEKKGDIYENFELINCISVCGKLYSTKLVKKHNIKFLENTKHEDNSFSIISYFKANNIVVVPIYTYYRRIRSNNSSTMQNLNLKTYEDLVKNYKVSIKKISKQKIPKKLYFLLVQKLNNYIVKINKTEKINYEKYKIDNYIEGIKKISAFDKKVLKLYSKIYFTSILILKRVLK